mmetsp:Transcript_25311/g.57547  ORF Transcript_25311/g.57547 Transcript_25311/m.57547 type:complete len:272 (+) Transcript_25311:2451-3266(+)
MSLLLFRTSGFCPSRGRRSCCFSWSSRRATVTAFWASSSAACDFSSADGRLAVSVVCSSLPASFNLVTAASASSIFALTTSTKLTRLRLAASTWKAFTLSMPASSCCLTLSSSLRAASAAPSARRPTSTALRATYFVASASADWASAAALSMRVSTSPASSGGMVSMPMRNGASVSRIFCSTSSMAATRSCACLRMGMAAARDCDSSTVRCALSSSACEASDLDCKSSILLRTAPLRPATFPEMSRIVGANVACAMRRASLDSRISAGLMS